jgi:hypothetical protein
MKKVKKTQRPVKVGIEDIEQRALRGEDVNKHFSGGKMMAALTDQIQRVNVDFGITTLQELDVISIELNVSRQAVIKLFVQRELDQHFLAKKARKEA